MYGSGPAVGVEPPFEVHDSPMVVQPGIAVSQGVAPPVEIETKV